METGPTVIVVVVFLGAATCAAVLWAVIGPALSNERFLRSNYRNASLSGIGGVPVVVVGALGSMVVLMSVSVETLDATVGFAGFQLAAGFGVLGFLDDIGGQAGGGGLVGHLRELRYKRVTTGLVKMVGGLLWSLLASALVTEGGASGVLRNAVLLAAGANLANLFDRAPGRSVKVASLVSVGLLVTVGLEPTLVPAALAVGAACGLLWFEMREQMMLGDTGVNVVGAMVALSAVVSLGSTALWVGMGVVLGLNVLSEIVSFSRVIAALPPLRWIDALGRLKS